MNGISRKIFLRLSGSVLAVAVLLVMALLMPTASNAVAKPAQALTWTLQFADEFNGSGALNGADWLYTTGTSYPGGPANYGTGEIENNTNSTANAVQTGGHLAIIPLCCWTAARVETQRTDFAAPAGGVMAVEGRIQQPNVTGAAAQGYWPAFWLLGEGARANRWGWPAIGEIDILENVNGQELVFGTLHCGVTPGGPCNENNGLGSGPHACPGCLSGYHTYRIEYDRSMSPEQVRWYLDGVQYHTVNANQVDATTWNNALHHGFHVILNLAMGGSWPGNPTASTASGVPFNIDYVRIYYGSACAGCPTPTPAPTNTPIPSIPYLGAPVALPGTIQAENFDKGGSGAGYYETTAGNQGGYNYRNDGNTDVDFANNCGICVNYIAPGEWLRYAVSVANAGSYTFNFRHAGGGGGVYHLETTTGVQLTGPITQVATANWDTYITYSQAVTLPAGNYGIVVKFDSCPACNLNNLDWISFTGGPTGPTPTRTNTTGPTATRTRTPTPGPSLTPTRTPTLGAITATPSKTPTTCSCNGFDAYTTIQAESFSAQQGITTQTTTDTGGGLNVSAIANGDWLQFNNVNFGATSPINVQTRVASGAAAGVSGLVEFHLDSVTGPMIGSFALASTGGWQSWTTIPANVSGATGTHNLFVVFKSGQPADYVNVNWLVFLH